MRDARSTHRRGLSAAWLWLAVALCAAPAGAAAPQRLLRADFDREPSCLSKQHGSQPGVGGRGAALLLPPGSECLIPAQGHLSPAAGTLSFWVRPHDWKDGEGRYQVFFEWSGQVEGRPFNFYVDSPAEAGVVRLVLTFGAGNDPHHQLFQIYAPARWQTGVWQKVDVTWDEREIVLYANGRAGERLALETVRLPDPSRLRLRLTPGGGRAGDASAIDEVEIWDAAFPADRIAKRFEASSAPPLAPARLRAPRVAAAPRVDGVLDDPAWRAATRIPLLADAETGFVGTLIPHASFAWSRDALHVAFEAPLSAPSDAFDVGLAPLSGGAARRFRVTTRGLAGEDAFVASPPVTAARIEGDAWRAELSIPFATLGLAPEAELALRLELRHLPEAPGLLAVGARLADAELRIGEESEGVRIDTDAGLATGRVALTFERGASGRAEVSVAKAGARVWRKGVALPGRHALGDGETREGLLRVAVEDGESRPLVRLESRLGPRGALGLLPIPDAEARKLAVELDLGWLDGSWRGALAAGRADARLVHRGPKREETLPVALADGRARVVLNDGLAEGDHRLALELRSGARALRFERDLEVPPLPWLGEKLGESEGVLDPWLPLGWDDDATVRVWNRRYGFDGPLLAQVSSGERPVLRAPMKLSLATAAGAVPFRTRSAKAVARSAARAEFAGTGGFEGAGVDVRWSSWIEYDGLVVSSFTLEPKAHGTRVEGLVLEIPLEPRIARFLRGMQQGSAIRRGRTPWNGDRFASSFEPFVWLSDDKEGFLFFAESAANWVGAERREALVVRGGANAGLTLRLIGAPVELPGPVTYTLGFQATPVKPAPKWARAWNLGVGGSPTPNETAVGYYVGYARADGLWELARPIAVVERDRDMARRAVRPLYYAATSATPDFLPVFRLFEPLWRSAWSYSYAAKAEPDNGLRPDVPEHRYASVCPADASFQARMLHDAKALLATGVLGVYTDTDEVFADDNPRHGCGYRDAFGRRGVTWSILAKRRFAKRLATLLREAGGERPYWLSHAHTRLVPPVYGFADFWYPGEELAGPLRRNPWLYSDVLDDEAWRVEYGSATSGIVHIFLPEFQRGSGDPKHLETRQPTESLLAMAAVNDVNVSAAYVNPEAIGEYWGLRKRLGLIEAEFVGHWEAGCPVRALAPEARASLYRTKRGPVLVVATRAPTATTVEVQLDRAALGLEERGVARDERAGKPLALAGERLSVPLEGRSYTYVTFR